ncbi:MAG: MATE family multidrug resistance protein [Sphingobacteriales bacterium]
MGLAAPKNRLSGSYSNILAIALPATVSGVVEPIISLVDTAFVGELGKEAIAAVGVGGSLYLLFVWILGQGKSALSALVSQHYGRRQLNRVRLLSFWAIITLVGLALLVAILTFIGSTFLLSLYGSSDLVLDVSNQYFQIRIFGLPFTIFYILAFGYFRGVQNTRIAMYTSVIGGVINLVLDYYFILELDYGIPGAAWASLIAQISMALFAWYKITQEWKISIRFPLFLGPLLTSFYRVTFQLFLRTGILNLVYFFANRTAAKLGDAPLAAHTIAMNIWLFSSFFLDGFANAANAIGGALFGQKNTSTLHQLRNRILLLGGSTGLLLGAVYYFLSPVWTRWFTEDADVIMHLNSILFLLAGIQCVNGLAFGLDGFYKGFGHATFLRNVLFISSVALFLPPLILSPFPGLVTVWFSMILWMFGRFIIPYMYFSRSILKS